jgi:peptide/nickel transport system ATP-binding protein
MVFQDPFAALNPMNSVLYTISRPLINYAGLSRQDAVDAARDLLERVGLTPAETFFEKRTGELSGGQAQRVVVAKALAVEPEVLVADEPISMLDVSIRAGILRLLDDLRSQRGFTLLYITHDLLSARLLADEVVVLRQGEIVEQGPASEVIRWPQHEYTQLLVRSIPNPRRGRVG